MYAILVWGPKDFLSFVQNLNGSVKTFDRLRDADQYADLEMANPDDARVISIEGVGPA